MIKFKNEAKELNPNQDLKINAGLIHMWKKAGLRVKSFKATKKGYNEIWAGKFKTKNATLEMSVNKYGDVFYHAGNKSVNIGRLDKQRKIIDWMKAIIRNSPWSESVNEGNLPSNIQKWIRARGPGPSKDVKMIGKWVKKLTGREISGGVAIGKNYNTLVLDIGYQDAAIHYDTTNGDVTLYDKKIRNFNGFKKVFQAAGNESVNERKLSSHQKKAILIAIQMSGNMTGATKKIEKIKKGLSKDKKVAGALRLANESVNEASVCEDTQGDEIHAKSKRELNKALEQTFKQLSSGKQPRHDIINGMSGEYIGLRMKDGGYELISSAIRSAMRELK